MTHEISIFVKILLNFKKKKLACKGKSETFFDIAKNQEFKLITLCHFKIPISLKPKWNRQLSVESNFFKIYKAIASMPILGPYFRFFFRKKKTFFRKSNKPGYENLVLIILTLQIELSKLNFNFDLWWYKNLFSSRFKGLLTNNFCRT